MTPSRSKSGGPVRSTPGNLKLSPSEFKFQVAYTSTGRSPGRAESDSVAVWLSRSPTVFDDLITK